MADEIWMLTAGSYLGSSGDFYAAQCRLRKGNFLRCWARINHYHRVKISEIVVIPLAETG